MIKKLNLGCGKDYKEGFINVDFCVGDTFKVDVNHNLEKFPYPFKDNEIDYILMDNVLEHLEDKIKVVEELHRISKPNATIEIYVPHCSSSMAFGNPTHKSFFSSSTFINFEPGSWEKYSEKEFYVKSKLIWLDSRDWVWIRPLKKLMNWLINKNHFITERFFASIIGIDHIKFTLKVYKPKEIKE